MKFTKMHGIGNDYVYVNCLEETVANPPETARFVSDRHFGIGSDGLILIRPSDCADFEMAMYNADGSRGEMCGNGVRCVAKYVYDYKLTDKTELTIETLGGIKRVWLTVADGRAVQVRVDMGRPVLDAAAIPVDYAVSPVISQPILVDGIGYQMTCVSMGNPHCVIYVEDVEGLAIEKIGPGFERHTCFPQRVNTEFAKVLDDHTVQMRVWERGSGETLACGTGACAVAVASILNGYTQDTVTVKLLGGDLTVEWNRAADIVYMTGPAAAVFEGEITLPDGL